MSTLESSTISSGLADAVLTKLNSAPTPLKLADIAKGLPRPRKVKSAELQEEVRKVLEEEVRLGRLFACPSGKADAVRYWARDEKHILRVRAVELAAVPQPLSALKTALGKEVKGTDGAFAEAVVRELIGDGRLFEHPPKTKKGKPLFGASPVPAAPPPLEQARHRKAVEKLANDCRKLLAAAGVGEEELLKALRVRLTAADLNHDVPPGQAAPLTPASGPVDPLPPDAAGLDALILKAVDTAPVVSLLDLRREMPAEFRGQAFDEAVLRLADRQQIIVSQDADPSRFSPEERAEYVKDGASLFTTIMRRN